MNKLTRTPMAENTKPGVKRSEALGAARVRWGTVGVVEGAPRSSIALHRANDPEFIRQHRSQLEAAMVRAKGCSAEFAHEVVRWSLERLEA